MSTEDALAVAYSILVRMQSAIDDADHESLSELFDDDAVLIGTSSHTHGREDVDAYVRAVIEQPGTFRWEWRDVVVFHESPGLLGAACFGEIVISGAEQEDRAPFRLTIFAVEQTSGWVIQQFHGSAPASF
jgi:uncharacterized protein (TIGR02246 family)